MHFDYFSKLSFASTMLPATDENYFDCYYFQLLLVLVLPAINCFSYLLKRPMVAAVSGELARFWNSIESSRAYFIRYPLDLPSLYS